MSLFGYAWCSIVPVAISLNFVIYSIWSFFSLQVLQLKTKTDFSIVNGITCQFFYAHHLLYAHHEITFFLTRIQPNCGISQQNVVCVFLQVSIPSFSTLNNCQWMHRFLLDHISTCAWSYLRIWIGRWKSSEYKRRKNYICFLKEANRKHGQHFRRVHTLHVNRWQSWPFCALVVCYDARNPKFRKLLFVFLFVGFYVWFKQCENFSLNFSSQTILFSTKFRGIYDKKHVAPNIWHQHFFHLCRSSIVIQFFWQHRTIYTCKK